VIDINVNPANNRKLVSNSKTDKNKWFLWRFIL